MFSNRSEDDTGPQWLAFAAIHDEIPKSRCTTMYPCVERLPLADLDLIMVSSYDIDAATMPPSTRNAMLALRVATFCASSYVRMQARLVSASQEGDVRLKNGLACRIENLTPCEPQPFSLILPYRTVSMSSELQS